MKSASQLMTLLICASLVWTDTAHAFEQWRSDRTGSRWTPALQERMNQETLTSRLAGGFTGNTPAQDLRRLGGRLLILGTAALALLAQDKPSKKELSPLRTPVLVKEAPLIQRQNRALITNPAGSTDEWSSPWDLTEAKHIDHLLDGVIRRHPGVAEKFYLHRAEWQQLLGLLAGEGRQLTLRSDQIRAPGLALLGPQSAIGHAMAFPEMAVSQPRKRVQTADTHPTEKTNPGFLHWRRLVRLAAQKAGQALQGVQIYSQNQVEATFLRDQQQAFRIRLAYAALEQSVFDQHEKASRAWTGQLNLTRMLEELRRNAWIGYRAQEREKRAAALEGRARQAAAPDEQRTLQAVSSLQAATQSVALARVALAETLAGGNLSISDLPARILAPEGPRWEITPERIAESDRVPSILKSENSTLTIPHPQPIPANPLNNWQEPLTAPDQFEAVSYARYEETQEPSVSPDRMKTLWSPVSADTPLGTSPQERLLLLQIELLQVAKEELKAQSETTWRFGIHFDLGSHPLLASLLNFDLRRPDRSTRVSYEELMKTMDLRQKAIEEEIDTVQIRQRAAFEKHRVQRQSALADLVKTRNEWVQARQEWIQAVQVIQSASFPSTPRRADAATPWLRLQTLEATYARHLTEAWSAQQMMRLYLPEGQKRVADQTRAYYAEVLNRLTPDQTPATEITGPSAPATTSPKRSLFRSRMIPLLTGAISVISASALSAHTFQPAEDGMSGAVQQVAMNVTLGAWNHSTENTLSGIAKNILEAAHPDHPGRISSKEIQQLVTELADRNHISDINRVEAGQVLDIGMIDADIAARLQDHIETSLHTVSPHTSVWTPPTTPVPAATPVLPVPAPSPAPVSVDRPLSAGNDSGNAFWDGVQTGSDWLVTHPEAIVIAVLVAGSFLIWLLSRHRHRSASETAYPPLSMGSRFLSSHRLWPQTVRGVVLPLVLGAGVLLFQSQDVVIHALKQIGSASHAIFPIAIVLGMTLVLALRPTLREKSGVRYLYPWAGGAWVAWMMAGAPLPILAAGSLLAVAVLTAAIRLPLQSPLNIVYQAMSNRVLILIMLPFLAIMGIQGWKQSTTIQTVRETISQEYEHRKAVLSQADILSPNYGVGVQTVHLPVTVAVPAEASGVVTAVLRSKTQFAAGDLIVALEPLSDTLTARLQSLNQSWKKSNGKALVAETPLARASMTHANALIRIKPNFETSTDRRISDWLDQISQWQVDLDIAESIAQEHKSLNGTYVLSYQGQALTHRIEALGLRISAELIRREQLHVPARQAFRILPGAGLISEGARLLPGRATPLLTQERSTDRILQLKLTVADARGLIQRWQTHATQTVIELRTAAGQPITIPLHTIEQVLDADDPVFGSQIRDESFFGPQYTNPAVGTADTVPLNLLVSHSDLKPGEPYRFSGIFDTDKHERVIASKEGVAIGFVSTREEDATAAPAQRAQRLPLQAHLQALESLLTRYETLQSDVRTFQREFPERDAPVQLLAEYNKTIDTLRSQMTALREQIADVDAEGLPSLSAAVQPLDPYRFRHYPLELQFPDQTPDQRVINWGSQVRVGISFYAAGSTLPEGGRVAVTWKPGADPVMATMTASRSLGRTDDLRRYTADVVVTPTQARAFFPNGKMTGGLVDVALKTEPVSAAPSWWNRLRTAIHPLFSIGASRSSLYEPGWMNAIWFIPMALFGHTWISETVLRLLQRTRRLASAPLPIDPIRPPVDPDNEDLYLNAPAEMATEVESRSALDEAQLIDFLSDLKDTVLEYEAYWYRGQPMTYLTLRQVLWDVILLQKERVQITPRKVFLRRFIRDGVTNTDTNVLNQEYQLQHKASAANSKASTFLWVLLLLGGGFIALFFFAEAGTISQTLRVIQANPMYMVSANGPGHGIIGAAAAIFIGGWILMSASESWGKLFATTPFNVSSVKLGISRLFNNRRKNFQSTTGKDAMAELNHIYKRRVLHPADDDYQRSMNRLDTLAWMLTQRARTHMQKDFSLLSPSPATLAFTNAFRTQIRRGHGKHLPIYPAHRIELADDDMLLRRMEVRHGIVAADLDPVQRYQYVQAARVNETLSLMERYPMHSLMALLRSDTTEFIAQTRDMPHHGLIEQILTELKERTNTLDEDVFDELRRQEGFNTFFETLHYLFEALRDAPVTADALQRRSEVLRFLGQGVTNFEQGTWNAFKQRLAALMSENGKTSEQIADDHNIVRGVVYTLTQRRLEEDPKKSNVFLDDLRRGKMHAREKTMEDGYLRGADRRASTTVLELTMAYQKYFDVLREFVSRFPDVRPLGNRQISITLANTVNLRQTLLELHLLYHLTGGKIRLLNVARTHNHFANLLNNMIPERASWSHYGRAKVIQLEQFFNRLSLYRRTEDILMSSAIPLEWQSVKNTAGERMFCPSPLLKPAMLVDFMIRENQTDLQQLFQQAMQHLMTRYERMQEEMQHLKSESEELAISLETWGLLVTSDTVPYRHPFMAALHDQMNSIRALMKERRLAHVRGRYKKLRETRDALLRDMRDLDNLRSEMMNVPQFMRSIGTPISHFTPDNRELKEWPPRENVMDGNYILQPFTVSPNRPAPRTAGYHTLSRAA